MTFRQATLVSILILLIAGCGSGGEQSRFEIGGLLVEIVSGPARLTISAPDGQVLFDGLPGGRVTKGDPPHVGFAVRRAAADFEMKFGSFRIEEHDAASWRAVTCFANLEQGEEALLFDMLSETDEILASATIEKGDAGEVLLTVSAADKEDNRVSAAFGCEAGEHFIGLGGQGYDVDHRGQTVPVWVQEDGISKIESDEYDEFWYLIGRRHNTHTPMPMFVSSRGYAVLAETDYRSVFSLCAEADEVSRIEVWEGSLRLRIFHGPSPAECVQKITGRLGRPELPPAFAFAPWLDALFGSENVRRVATKLRDEDVPASVIWTEDWRGGQTDSLGYTLDEDWRLDRELYPDFEELAADLHAAGFKFLTYNNTFLSEGVDVWDEALAGGYTIEDTAGEPFLFQNPKFEYASLLDVSNPAARAWATQVYREGLEQGADGYMADYAEWLPVEDIVLASGENPEAAHNLYPVEVQKLQRELFDELEEADGVERLFFVRSAYVGSQPLVSVVWAGDQQTDFSLGDGMPSVIPMGIGLGVCGFPYFGHDIGGYMSQFTEPTTRELWFRWVSFGALSPVMRTHHGKSALENWNFESDAESTAHFRRWARLHIRLFPYLYALADQATQTGMPIMRPLALDHPGFDPGWGLTDQYMLGDRIYVAPVVQEGATSRSLQLPGGTYYPLAGGDVVEVPDGGGEIDAAAAIEDCPAFVPAGSILVLLPEEIDTLAPAAEESGAVTLSTVGDDREIWLWPGGESGWTEVTGLTYEWNGTQLELPLTSAEFEGEAVEVIEDTIAVEGNGTLTINGDSTLVVSGGAEDRSLVIRAAPQF